MNNYYINIYNLINFTEREREKERETLLIFTYNLDLLTKLA